MPIVVAYKYLDKQACGQESGAPYRVKGWLMVPPAMSFKLLDHDMRSSGRVFWYAETLDKKHAWNGPHQTRVGTGQFASCLNVGQTPASYRGFREVSAHSKSNVTLRVVLDNSPKG